MPRRPKPPAAKLSDLVVVPNECTPPACRQYEIENAPDARRLHDYDHDRDYVQIGGYFGPHNPATFAAAPKLLAAAKALLRELAELRDAPALGKAEQQLRSAVIEAEGLAR